MSVSDAEETACPGCARGLDGTERFCPQCGLGVGAPACCPGCQRALAPQDRFCAGCGAAVQAPPRCPGCADPVPLGSRQCPGCGLPLVGARPQVARPTAAPAADAATEAAGGASTGLAPAAGATPKTPGGAPAAPADRPAPPRPPPPASSGIGANVLVFVAVAMLIVVGVYELSKRQHSPATRAPVMTPPAGPAAAGDDASQPAPNVAAAAPSDAGAADSASQPASTAKRRASGSPPAVGTASQTAAGTQVGGEGDHDATAQARGEKASQPQTEAAQDQTQPTAGALVGGQLGLAPGQTAPTGATLFISLHPVAGGPPVAALRRDHPRFPLHFVITRADMMQPGAPVKGPFKLRARLDLDGDASTRDPKELGLAGLEPVAEGRMNLSLMLTEAK